jgi:hypothetical protein
MILAEHALSRGAVSDQECIARITKLLDAPEAVIVALDLLRNRPDGDDRAGQRDGALGQ